MCIIRPQLGCLFLFMFHLTNNKFHGHLSKEISFYYTYHKRIAKDAMGRGCSTHRSYEPLVQNLGWSV
jgi:hypothetical protein